MAAEHIGNGAAARSGRIRQVVILVITAMLAAFAFATSLANAVATRNPDLALRLDGDQSLALTAAAQRAIAERQGAAAAGVRELATRSAMADPTYAPGLAALGIADSLQNRLPAAKRAFFQAERLSRRHLPTELWLIEEAVGRGDTREVLRHYDIALRTSIGAPSILFPIMVEAVAEPALLTELTHLLARRPVWSEQFLQQLAQSGIAFKNIAQLFIAMRRNGAPVAGRTLMTFVDRQVDARRYDEAWMLYAAYNPGRSRDGIRDGAFERPAITPTAFDWTFMQDTAFTELRATERGRSLYFEMPASGGGTVARQLLLLAPGRRRLALTATDVSDDAATAPYVLLTCADDGRELGRASLAGAPASGQRIGFETMIAGDCRAQWLAVMAQPSDRRQGNSGYIDQVEAR